MIELPDIFSGYITSVKKNPGGGKIEITALSFGGMLSWRVLVEYAKNDSIMTIIDKNCGSSAITERRFPNTVFDKTADAFFSPPKSCQRKSLINYVSRFIETGLRICSEIVHFGGGAKIRIFGRFTQDHRFFPNENMPIILSESYDTLAGQKYSYSESSALTGAYVYAMKSTNTGIVWGAFKGDSSGFERCEESIKIEAVTDYSFELVNGKIQYTTWIDYAATEEEAEDVFLARKQLPEEVVTAELGNGVNEAFRKGQFFVGDTVTLYPDEKDELSARRITKITETYSNGSVRMNIYLGNQV